MIARALARLDGDDLVLTMRDGTVHSRISVDDTMDPAEALERISEGAMPVRLLWSLLRTRYGCRDFAVASTPAPLHGPRPVAWPQRLSLAPGNLGLP